MKKVAIIAVAIVAVVAAVFLLPRRDVASTEDAVVSDATPRRIGEETGRPADERTATVDAMSRHVEEGQGESILTRQDAASTEEEPQTAEEKREAAEEKLVNDFDDLTDKWQEPSTSKPVTMSDIDNFAKSFRKIPKARRDECIHRALNLIPDENVMLLAGVLMDKSMDKETVETVYNDILNRDEDVKKPILQQIFKDKTHPCWADTAWILDVTGELPKAK